MISIPTLPKPPHGSACNGCGRCCYDELCPLGEMVIGRSLGPCPALQTGPEHTLVCGLIANPGAFAPVRTAVNGPDEMSKAAALLIGAGMGCDAQIQGEPRDMDFSAKIRQIRQNSIFRIARAMKLWGM